MLHKLTHADALGFLEYVHNVEPLLLSRVLRKHGKKVEYHADIKWLAQINVEHYLNKLCLFLFLEKTVVESATKTMIERGRHTFWLSFLAIGKSSRNGATYPQNCGHPTIPWKGAAPDQPGQGDFSPHSSALISLTSMFLNFAQDASFSAMLHPFLMELCPMIWVESIVIKFSWSWCLFPSCLPWLWSCLLRRIVPCLKCSPKSW